MMEVKVKYVGAMTNRDPDLMAELKSFFKIYGVETIEIEPDEDFDEIELTKRQINLILPKLMSKTTNGKLFKKLRKTNLHFLNSLKAVRLCQSRRRMFTFAKKYLPEVKTPRMFKKLKGIKKVLKEGRTIWVRRDAHNIPKEERVLGIVHSLEELHALIQNQPPNKLFFQEYLGETNETYKAYIIDTTIFVLKRTGIQNGVDPNPHIVVERVTPPKEIQETILRIGSIFGMAVYGVDYFYHNGEVVFFDFNDFPSFRGIPEAVQTIWEFIANNYLSDSESDFVLSELNSS